MVSHEYRCIFVHIPRCAGTSIENWIVGDDWWNIQRETKHLIASQARKIYSDVWDRYYKFAFVRHPVERMISCLNFDRYFGLSYSRKKGISFSGYHELFGNEIVLEHDYRFWKRETLIAPHHRTGTVYGNILDEQLDFVGRVENIAEDAKIVARAIGKGTPFHFHHEKTKRFTWPNIARRRFFQPVVKADSLSKTEIMHIEHMCRDEMARFSYPSFLSV
jgi:hypothetical protein